MSRSRVVANGDVLGADMRDRVKWFERETRRVSADAARQATARSRSKFRSELSRSARPTTSPRPGRLTTQGAFADFIQWAPAGRGDRVKIQLAALEAAAPYWLIQEIGTGASAYMGGVRGGQGRGGSREQGNVSVKSQAGRVLPYGLTWSGSSGANEQVVPGRGPRIVISAGGEIRGKHYIRDGATSGWKRYEARMHELAHRVFSNDRK